jgi:hypothetical protein
LDAISFLGRTGGRIVKGDRRRARKRWQIEENGSEEDE